MLINKKKYIRRKLSHEESHFQYVILPNGTIPNLLQFAISKFKKDEIIKPHSHLSMSEVFFIKKEKVKVIYNGKTFIANLEDSIVIKASKEHSFYFLEDTELLYLGIKTDC